MAAVIQSHAPQSFNNIGSCVTIFSGDQLVVHRGGDSNDFYDLLPMGVAASIEKVHREYDFATLSEHVIVLFKNGHKAMMCLIPDLTDPVDDDVLKEFQARCLMIHDL